MIEQNLTPEFMEFLKEFLKTRNGTKPPFELQLEAVKEFQKLQTVEASQ